MIDKILCLRGDIDTTITGKIMDSILALNEDDEDLEPIHLYIQSDGGVAMDGYSLVDIIKYNSIKIN